MNVCIMLSHFGDQRTTHGNCLLPTYGTWESNYGCQARQQMLIHLIGLKYIYFFSFIFSTGTSRDWFQLLPSSSHERNHLHLFIYSLQFLSVCQMDAFVIVPCISSKNQFIYYSRSLGCVTLGALFVFFFFFEFGVYHLALTPWSGEGNFSCTIVHVAEGFSWAVIIQLSCDSVILVTLVLLSCVISVTWVITLSHTELLNNQP